MVTNLPHCRDPVATGIVAPMKIVDAVTATLFHEGELLMTRRQPALPAFGGFHAFPGGKVDAADRDAPCPIALRQLAGDAVEAAVLCALARELDEELGIDLAAMAEAGEIRAVHAIGTALTPAHQPLRFNTYFMRVDLTRRPALTVDARETAEAFWATPADLMARYRAGAMLMAPPTRITLQVLAADPDALHIPNLDAASRGHGIPILEPMVGVRQLPVRSHTLPPAQHTNCFLLGDMASHRILVDPSPASDEEMERLIEAISPIGVHEVFITHHHPDHSERAERIADRLNLTIGMSADTRHRLMRSKPQFFNDTEIHLYQEGDVVCRWLGQPVHVLEVPGHDAGQLALMPESRAWCLVGDLIQGIGTVVIPEEEGDMRAYFNSLQRVIDLNPGVLLPSHGNALGETYRLVETLKHRRMREAQILTLHQQGLDVDGMLPTVYAGVDQKLWPLARQNIRMHLRKLVDEGQIA